ncbi:related to Thymidylate kinase [Hanseniaspora guilliermondii]|uniref:dTMP kinase n=1 Tax=Hanseniaspora guilliermondii TaxID=56406 RepID=A0A1L0AYZ8_9ASCO|nr:related to Thymidylate kinase [Hanseniaspora guilliermondii]
MSGNRGRLILIEGLDRTGKTTQCTLLSKDLNFEYYKFPNRETPIGKIINEYLTKNMKLSDQSIHLLFSSNRWELQKIIKNKLDAGIDCILDRYVYSGLAYSAAKNVEGMDLKWCLQPDIGLLKPDLTIFLTNDSYKDNKGFGEEIYENTQFQDSVKEKFKKIFSISFEEEEYLNYHFKNVNVTGLGIEEVNKIIVDIVSNHQLNNNEYLYY